MIARRICLKCGLVIEADNRPEIVIIELQTRMDNHNRHAHNHPTLWQRVKAWWRR